MALNLKGLLAVLFGLGFHMRLSDEGFKIEEMLVLNSANQLCYL